MISTLGWHYWGWKHTKCVAKRVHCVIPNGSSRTNQRKCGKCSVSQVQTKIPARCVNRKLSEFIMLLRLTFPGSSARKSEWQDIPVTFVRKETKWSVWREMDRHDRAGFLPSLWNNAHLNQCQWMLIRTSQVLQSYPNVDDNQSTVISTKREAEQKSSEFLIKNA